jgi:membrane-associated phospholipid phosphatase
MRKFTTIILLFCFISVISDTITAQNTDYKILKSLNESSDGLRNYSAFISNSTKISSVAIPVVMGSVALFQKNDALLQDAIYIGVSMGVNTVLTYGLKYSVNRERPYITHPDLNVDPAFYESSASFPSGHTSLAFSVATSLSLTHPKWYVIAPAYLWAGSVGYSRLNLGVHYPTDVLAGAVLGVGSAYLTYKANEWYQKKRAKKKLANTNAFLIDNQE